MKLCYATIIKSKLPTATSAHCPPGVMHIDGWMDAFILSPESNDRLMKLRYSKLLTELFK